MVALAVGTVGDFIVQIHVVEGEGHLGAAVGGVGVDGEVDVELVLLLCDLSRSQKVQAGDILVIAHALLFGVELQRVLQACAGEGDVVVLHAGVDDRNAGACAGDAAGPDLVGAGLRGGAVHVGLVALVLGGVGLILGLQDHGLDAV